MLEVGSEVWSFLQVGGRMKNIGKDEFKDLINSWIKEFNDLILNDIQLNECSLNDLEFNRCEFNKLDCHKGSLSNIYFRESKFIDCDFSESNLNLLVINHSELENVKFNKCVVDNVMDQYGWTSTNFNKCEFESINILSSIEVVGCDFTDCSFENAVIKCPEFCNCNIKGCNMKCWNANSDLGGNYFYNANL